jgi:hypothetical protein
MKNMKMTEMARGDNKMGHKNRQKTKKKIAEDKPKKC